MFFNGSWKRNASAYVREESGESRTSELSMRELIAEIVRTGSQLARKEVDLAKAELRSDIRSEVSMAVGLAITAACGIVALGLLLVAAVLGLAEGGVLPGWLGALLAAGLMIVLGAVIGLVSWKKRVRQPLDETRDTVKETMQWARSRIKS